MNTITNYLTTTPKLSFNVDQVENGWLLTLQGQIV